MFGLSKREIDDRFTKSELMLLAWRSQEMSYNMKKQSDDTKTNAPRAAGSGIKHQQVVTGELPQDLPDHFFRKDDDPEAGVKAGELDLRQVTGADAYRLFQKMGIKLPVIQR